MNRYILPLTYLGPLSYYLHRVNDACIIEQNNYYERHTYANRCEILSSHGIIALSIPVIKPVKGTPIKEIRLSDHGDWQKSHWRSIESAYNSSPFFEYYRDELERIYQKDYNYLIDFNMDLENCILELLEYIDLNCYLSESYIEVTKNNEFDLRNEIVPKKKGLYLHNNLKVPYYQVFQSSEGFSADLSILDLLFNMGNESRIYLKTI